MSRRLSCRSASSDAWSVSNGALPGVAGRRAYRAGPWRRLNGASCGRGEGEGGGRKGAFVSFALPSIPPSLSGKVVQSPSSRRPVPVQCASTAAGGSSLAHRDPVHGLGLVFCLLTFPQSPQPSPPLRRSDHACELAAPVQSPAHTLLYPAPALLHKVARRGHCRPMGCGNSLSLD